MTVSSFSSSEVILNYKTRTFNFYCFRYFCLFAFSWLSLDLSVGMLKVMDISVELSRKRKRESSEVKMWNLVL